MARDFFALPVETDTALDIGSPAKKKYIVFVVCLGVMMCNLVGPGPTVAIVEQVSRAGQGVVG